MYSYLLTLLCLVALLNTKAQNIIDYKNCKADLSAAHKNAPGYKRVTRLLDDGKKGFLYIEVKAKTGLALQRIDKDLSAANIDYIAFADVPAYQYCEFMQVDGKNWLFYAKWSSADKKQQLYAQQLDLENNRLIGDVKLLISSNKLTLFAWDGLIHNDGNIESKYSMHINADSTKLLIAYRDAARTEAGDPVGVYIFNNAMEKLYGKEMMVPFETCDAEEVTVDYTGNIFFTTSEKIQLNDSDYKLKYTINKINIQSGELTKIEPKLAKEALIDLRLIHTPNAIYVVGKHYKEGEGDGFCLSKWDGTSNIFSKVGDGHWSVPIKVLRKYANPYEWKAYDEDPKKYVVTSGAVLRKLIPEADGSYTLICEQKWADGDIIMMRISNKGEMIWCDKIAKHCVGYYTGPAGFTLLQYAGYYYFLFLDTKANLNPKVDELPASAVDRDKVLACVRVDDKGKQSKTFVFETDKNKTHVYRGQLGQIGANQLVMTHSSGRILRLTVKD